MYSSLLWKTHLRSNSCVNAVDVKVPNNCQSCIGAKLRRSPSGRSQNCVMHDSSHSPRAWSTSNNNNPLDADVLNRSPLQQFSSQGMYFVGGKTRAQCFIFHWKLWNCREWMVSCYLLFPKMWAINKRSLDTIFTTSQLNEQLRHTHTLHSLWSYLLLDWMRMGLNAETCVVLREWVEGINNCLNCFIKTTPSFWSSTVTVRNLT